MKLIEAVAKRIDGLLQERHMTQYELSKQGGIPRSTLSVIIAGKLKTVRLDTIYQIVSTLGITLEEFFSDNIFNDVTD